MGILSGPKTRNLLESSKMNFQKLTQVEQEDSEIESGDGQQIAISSRTEKVFFFLNLFELVNYLRKELTEILYKKMDWIFFMR